MKSFIIVFSHLFVNDSRVYITINCLSSLMTSWHTQIFAEAIDLVWSWHAELFFAPHVLIHTTGFVRDHFCGYTVQLTGQ